MTHTRKKKTFQQLLEATLLEATLTGTRPMTETTTVETTTEETTAEDILEQLCKKSYTLNSGKLVGSTWHGGGLEIVNNPLKDSDGVVYITPGDIKELSALQKLLEAKVSKDCIQYEVRDAVETITKIKESK